MKQIGQYDTEGRTNSNRYRTYDIEGISPTLTAGMGAGGNLQPFVPEPFIVDDQGRLNKKLTPMEINQDGTSNTLTSVQKDNYVISKPPFRIRKLTPLECFRLQGFPDELFYKAQEVNSNSQLYKQAGNSVTVNVIEAIANRLTTI